MTDGLWINGRRPKSKKEIKDFLKDDYDKAISRIEVESTSMFGGYSGRLENAPGTVTFVGPDPYTSRKFYGNLKFNAAKDKWVCS